MHYITKLYREKAAKRRLLKGVKKEFEEGWVGRRRKQRKLTVKSMYP
jgi:hypothetical protein